MRASIDRIEGNLAILIFEGISQPIKVPQKILPLGSKEGDFLEIKIKKSSKVTKNIKDEVSTKIKRMSEDS